jgi:hypothetical protein
MAGGLSVVLDVLHRLFDFLSTDNDGRQEHRGERKQPECPLVDICIYQSTSAMQEENRPYQLR